MALGRRAPGGLVVDARIVDDRVHPADRIDLVPDVPRLRRAAEIADRLSLYLTRTPYREPTVSKP